MEAPKVKKAKEAEKAVEKRVPFCRMVHLFEARSQHRTNRRSMDFLGPLKPEGTHTTHGGIFLEVDCGTSQTSQTRQKKRKKLRRLGFFTPDFFRIYCAVVQFLCVGMKTGPLPIRNHIQWTITDSLNCHQNVFITGPYCSPNKA